MRLILFVMVLCYAIVFWPFGFLLADVLFPWGGVMESHLKPIYWGIVFLSGLMVACTVYIAELIKELKNKN